jgi:hypothetical protein
MRRLASTKSSSRRQEQADQTAAGFGGGKPLFSCAPRGASFCYPASTCDARRPSLCCARAQSWTHSWSLDGDKIAFAGFRNGAWNVWWVSRSTKQQKQFTNYTRLNSFVR